ncbi:peptidoglycan-binding protein [Lentzea sp. BCCO 10_0061]|uniref:Peptidoglycan-binding protein n=1 Tax=Lentzea sokolovensis TaxID=3095429 RepID=A0ABU4VDI1_9PSEU|nr:peptidoglycan-binding protein [Lentzea sp. BCCO 10_0061]MDX8148998.1 peptidoglycan-binding protein [Lentzea sp. BCCO 10_0061]
MKRWIIAGVVALVLVSGVLALTWTRRAPAQSSPPPAPRTVAVVKTDLTDVREFKATLGFGASQEVTGRRAGTLTWLPAPGAAVDRGAAVYKVDNRPVWLFFGDTPLWRKLDKAGTKGPDVKIVKDNLGALGYKLGGAPDELTQATIDAVKRWQKAEKVEESGVIDPGDVVVLSGKVRVESVTAKLSASGEGSLMSVTATGKAVDASIDARQAEVFKKDLKVTVVLPNGTETAGTVRSVSTEAKSEKNGNGEETPVIAVDIGLDTEVGEFDSGPVRIRLTSTARQGVLAVPVTALLALREGGYAVQTEEGGLVAVKTGLFAGGLVEISGGGLSEGMRVVTTS